MRTFEHNDNHYLQIKDHNFHILNMFSTDYIQCTTNSSSGIVKEYLPKGWELSKARYNGQMIFTLYKKSLFNYKSKSKSIGTLMFIALSEEGAKYLLYRWILNEQLGIDDTEENINIVAEAIGKRQIDTVYDRITNQKMHAVKVSMNDYYVGQALKSVKYTIESKSN